jgi:hypothetical protein
MVRQSNEQQQRPQNEVAIWYYGVPLFTRVMLTCTALVSLAVNLQFLSPYSITLTSAVTKKLQIWRLYLNYAYAGSGYSLLFNMFFFYTYSRQLEESYFQGKPADYFYFLFIVMGIGDLVGFYMRYVIMSQSLIAAIVYVWSQVNRDRTVNFMFGLQFKAFFLPFVLLAYELILTGSLPINMAIGIAIGHLYWFLKNIYPTLPNSSGVHPLATPSFFVSLFPPTGPPRMQQQQAQTENQSGFRTWGGSGRRLGN